ncbi:MAG: NfeD family protein [candidate division Zixibacteria bacterium]|nr:NfeD family protein [candidate division Zixibacteria bacterium]
MEAWHVWIIIGIVLAIIEIFTTDFMNMAFGPGAFVTALFAALGFGFKVQLFIFALSTIVVFIFMRKVAVKYLTKDKPETRTNVDALVDREAIVTVTVGDQTKQGQVKIGGEEWSAVSADGEEIHEGEKVVVTAIDGNKVIVKKAE